MRDWREETIYDSNCKQFNGLPSSMRSRVDTRLKNKHAAIRIKNIDEQSIAGADLNKIYSGAR